MRIEVYLDGNPSYHLGAMCTMNPDTFILHRGHLCPHCMNAGRPPEPLSFKGIEGTQVSTEPLVTKGDVGCVRCKRKVGRVRLDFRSMFDLKVKEG